MWLAVCAAGATNRILVLRRVTVFIVGLPPTSTPSPPPRLLLLALSFQRAVSLFMDRQSSWVLASSLSRFLDHTQTQNTRWSPPNEWAAGRRDLYLATHDTHKREIATRDSNPQSQQVNVCTPTVFYCTTTGIGVQTICYPLFGRALVPVFREYRIFVLKYLLNPNFGCYTQALAQEKLT